MTARLGPTGIFSNQLRYGDPGQAAALAAELECLGYTALWFGDTGGDVFTPVGNLLAATARATVATGILNVWMHSPEDVAVAHARLVAEHGSRFMCGLGVSHRAIVDRAAGAGRYGRPVETMSAYLDRLDRAPIALAVEDRVLAALGPKMLGLARTRAAGTHPYLVTPDLTAAARAGVGPDGVVASEQGVVLAADPATARGIARTHLTPYFRLPNYVNNWRRQGFTDDDFADAGSNRLIDALIAWGDEAKIAARVQEHRDAGASHVCIHVITQSPESFPVHEWRALAPALT